MRTKATKARRGLLDVLSNRFVLLLASTLFSVVGYGFRAWQDQQAAYKKAEANFYSIASEIDARKGALMGHLENLIIDEKDRPATFIWAQDELRDRKSRAEPQYSDYTLVSLIQHANILIDELPEKRRALIDRDLIHETIKKINDLHDSLEACTTIIPETQRDRMCENAISVAVKVKSLLSTQQLLSIRDK
jgi:hypothetical protein